MRRLVAAAVLLALAAAVPAEAKKRPPRKPQRPAKHRLHAPPTPKIKAGRAEPLTVQTSAPAPQASAPDPVITDPGTPAPGPVAPLPRTLGVLASEFKLALSRTTVGAGAVTIQLSNAGEDGHDLRVETLTGTLLAAWDELPAEAPAVTKAVTLTAGTYRLYCSLPGHAAVGMDTRLSVQ